MSSLRPALLATLTLTLASCAPSDPGDTAPPGAQAATPADTLGGTPAAYRPNPAVDKLRAPITVAEGLQVVISDVPIPPNQSVDLHYHPGEEFVYVLEGSAVHAEPGQPDRVHAEPGQPARVWVDDAP